jgi:4-diphosphocytidyl-2-C-methyl-D-erythritol kinase
VGRARALAPAKINPRLEIRGRRPDGYHEISTFMVALDLCDEVEAHATRDAGIRLALDGPALSSDVRAEPDNLAWRAASAALERARSSGLIDAATGVDLRLIKRIPSQSGLGGASADAAAAWLAVRAAIAPQLSDEDGRRALEEIGSDCAFFLAAARTGAALCEGRGEIVTPVASPRSWSVVVLTPSVACPTAAVYRAAGIHLRQSGASPSLRLEWMATGAHAAREFLENQLEPAAFVAVPELRRWRELFDDAGGAHFCISGSGSSFFGIFDDDSSANAALERVVELARARRLVPRLATVAHPCGHGSRVVLDS